jgi:hypothetical protein
MKVRALCVALVPAGSLTARVPRSVAYFEIAPLPSKPWQPTQAPSKTRKPSAPPMEFMSLGGVVTLSEIGPIWTINQQAKSLKSLASTLAILGKFRSV